MLIIEESLVQSSRKPFKLISRAAEKAGAAIREWSRTHAPLKRVEGTLKVFKTRVLKETAMSPTIMAGLLHRFD